MGKCKVKSLLDDIESIKPMTRRQFKWRRFKRRIKRLLLFKKKGLIFTHIDFIEDGKIKERVKL